MYQTNLIQRLTLLTGTSKIQQLCTSTIRAMTNEDGSTLIGVSYTHNGHSKQVEHVRLTNGKREEIAANLQQGVSKGKILNDISDEAVNQFIHDVKRHS